MKEPERDANLPPLYHDRRLWFHAAAARPGYRLPRTRRKDILAHMNEHGREGGKAAQWASYQTRGDKEAGLDMAELKHSWRERAKGMGLDLKGMVRAAKERVVEREVAQFGQPKRGKETRREWRHERLQPSHTKEQGHASERSMGNLPIDSQSERERERTGQPSRTREQSPTRHPPERERDDGPEWGR